MPPSLRRQRRIRDRQRNGQLRYSDQLEAARDYLYRHTTFHRRQLPRAVADRTLSDREYSYPFLIDDSVPYERRRRTLAYPYISFEDKIEPIRSARIHPPPPYYRLVHFYPTRQDQREDFFDAYQVADFCLTGYDPDVEGSFFSQNQ
jgi:hypothetical protein